MRIILQIAVPLILSLSFASRLQAQRAERPSAFSLGGYYSLKGCGIAAVSYREGRMVEIRAAADFYGILDGRYRRPGWKISGLVTHDLKTFCLPEDLRLAIYAGPGITAGYVRDIRTGPGPMAGLCAGVGVALSFASKIELSAGFSGELAWHLTMRSAHDTVLIVYNRGLLNFAIPELSLRYRF